ncbi:MAG: N-acetylglucosamine-6-phosphate deacetylase, partial [Muribaculaceae bacterium]|nr:N-acetylglucosamine-6-phosphate deacetylase [Muribaculaceae bacterium]
MLTQIYNGQILTPSGWINDGSLLFEDSRIVEIRKNSNIEPRAETAINALGMYVVPGGIDLHCHGGG